MSTEVLLQEWIPSSRISPVFPEIAQKLRSFLCSGHSTWSPLDFSRHRTGPHSIPLESLSQFLTAWLYCAHSLVSICNTVDCTPPGSSVCGVFFSRQEYWSRLPFHTRWDLPNPRMEPKSQASPALAGGFFTTSATWEALIEN